MDINSELVGRLIRVVAIVTLLLGLSDASRLLGISLGDVSPITTLGLSGFIYLAIFTLARLFAAVGLWSRASWGGLLLAAATAMELGLYFSGSRDVQISLFGLIVRLLLMISIIAFLIFALRHRRAAAHD